MLADAGIEAEQSETYRAQSLREYRVADAPAVY